MANYPDWVLKHKTKGTYINKVGEKYYLYAAHSERIKGTNKVKRICDGYIGRITQEEGLIPSKAKKITSPTSFELGNSYVILTCTDKIWKGFQHSFPKNGTLIYVCSVLHVIYGYATQELLEHSYLCILFDSISIPENMPSNLQTAIHRGTRMITDILTTTFGDDLVLLQAHLRNVHLIFVNHNYYCYGLSPSIVTLSDTYHISWRNTLWQN